ncbi:MAG: hypothetical protein KGI51_09475 [Rhodospirillales bacterium]|nr:hypothetical protein [Rhodospirillales bacterium]
MARQGFLAIWCEIGASDLAEYHNWQTQEHIADRVYSPGFLGMRLFSAIDNPCAHFFLYATESAAVLRSAAYRAILDNPSPWTRRLMPKFGPFDRAVGEKLVKIGRGFGSHVLASRIRTDGRPVDPAAAKAALRNLINLPDTVGARLLATDHATTDAASEEKAMRGSVEGDFDTLLVVEALSAEGAHWARERLAAALAAALPGLRSFDALVCRMIYGEAPHEGEMPG